MFLCSEILQNIFQHLHPDCLDIVKKVCRTFHSASAPLLSEFVTKHRIQKLRRMFFDVYDKLRAGFPPRRFSVVELPSFGDFFTFVKGAEGRVSFLMIYGNNYLDVTLSEYGVGLTCLRYNRLKIFHNNIRVNQVHTRPLPDDLYTFIRAVLRDENHLLQ